MKDTNKLIVSGRLVRDPTVRRAVAGAPVALFTLTTKNEYRPRTGEFTQEAAFIPCIAFNRDAEMLSNRMKGEPVLVVGRLQTGTNEQDNERLNQLTLVCESVRCFAVPPAVSPPMEE